MLLDNPLRLMEPCHEVYPSIRHSPRRRGHLTCLRGGSHTACSKCAANASKSTTWHNLYRHNLHDHLRHPDHELPKRVCARGTCCCSQSGRCSPLHAELRQLTARLQIKLPVGQKEPFDSAPFSGFAKADIGGQAFATSNPRSG